MTTGAQRRQEMGRTALRSILRPANGETLESTHVERATQLVVRDSTTAPAA